MTKIEIAQKIDNQLMKILPDLIYEELKYMRKNESENVDEEIQNFLCKDLHDEYYRLSPLVYRLDEILNTLYKETPYEKYRD